MTKTPVKRHKVLMMLNTTFAAVRSSRSDPRHMSLYGTLVSLPLSVVASSFALRVLFSFWRTTHLVQLLRYAASEFEEDVVAMNVSFVSLFVVVVALVARADLSKRLGECQAQRQVSLRTASELCDEVVREFSRRKPLCAATLSATARRHTTRQILWFSCVFL